MSSDKNRITFLNTALHALNSINDLDPTGDQWRECTKADHLCQIAGVPIWDAFGTNHIPALDKAKREIQETLDCLEYDDTNLVRPSMDMLIHWMKEGVCEAACKCESIVEPDGYCHHGKPSWLLVMGLI